MKNLTATQTEIIKNIEAEFSKINEVDTSTDILSQIDNAINEKRILRKQLVISNKANAKSIEIIKDEILGTLQQIADKYNFTLQWKRKKVDGDYYVTLIFNGYYTDSYPAYEREVNGTIIMPTRNTEGIVHFYKPIPDYQEGHNINTYDSKEKFIQFFVNKTIETLKSKI